MDTDMDLIDDIAYLEKAISEQLQDLEAKHSVKLTLNGLSEGLVDLRYRTVRAGIERQTELFDVLLDA